MSPSLLAKLAAMAGAAATRAETTSIMALAEERAERRTSLDATALAHRLTALDCVEMLDDDAARATVRGIVDATCGHLDALEVVR